MKPWSSKLCRWFMPYCTLLWTLWAVCRAMALPCLQLRGSCEFSVYCGWPGGNKGLSNLSKANRRFWAYWGSMLALSTPKPPGHWLIISICALYCVCKASSRIFGMPWAAFAGDRQPLWFWRVVTCLQVFGSRLCSGCCVFWWGLVVPCLTCRHDAGIAYGSVGWCSLCHCGVPRDNASWLGQWICCILL